MRLRVLRLVVAGVLLVGHAVGGSGQTKGATIQNQAANDAPVGSEKSPLKVSSGVMMGLALHQEMPHYPVPKCGDPAYLGHVVTRAIINPEGKVDKLEVISGPEADREANLTALRQWTFKPYLLNGTAVWVQTVITVIIDFGACEPK